MCRDQTHLHSCPSSPSTHLPIFPFQLQVFFFYIHRVDLCCQDVHRRVKGHLVEHGQPLGSCTSKENGPSQQPMMANCSSTALGLCDSLAFLPWSCTCSHGSFEFVGGMDGSFPGNQCHRCHPLPAALSLPTPSCAVLSGP